MCGHRLAGRDIHDNYLEIQHAQIRHLRKDVNNLNIINAVTLNIQDGQRRYIQDMSNIVRSAQIIAFQRQILQIIIRPKIMNYRDDRQVLHVTEVFNFGYVVLREIKRVQKNLEQVMHSTPCLMQ